MSANVKVKTRSVMASALRLSARQCRHAPIRPTPKNSAARPRPMRAGQSRPNCQLKYCR